MASGSRAEVFDGTQPQPPKVVIKEILSDSKKKNGASLVKHVNGVKATVNEEKKVTRVGCGRPKGAQGYTKMDTNTLCNLARLISGDNKTIGMHQWTKIVEGYTDYAIANDRALRSLESLRKKFTYRVTSKARAARSLDHHDKRNQMYPSYENNIRLTYPAVPTYSSPSNEWYGPVSQVPFESDAGHAADIPGCPVEPAIACYPVLPVQYPDYVSEVVQKKERIEPYPTCSISLHDSRMGYMPSCMNNMNNRIVPAGLSPYAEENYGFQYPAYHTYNPYADLVPLYPRQPMYHTLAAPLDPTLSASISVHHHHGTALSLQLAQVDSPLEAQLNLIKSAAPVDLINSASSVSLL